MDFDDLAKPSLTEPGVKYFLHQTLKQYILSKIQNFQHAKRAAQQELITGLPAWESEHDMIHSKSTY